MPFARPLGLALLAVALAATGACNRVTLFAAPAKPMAAAAKPTVAPPEDIVRKHAPSDEIALLNGKQAFASGAQAPAELAAGQAPTDSAARWKQTVLGIGQFNDWVGYTKAIDTSGRIEISLSDGLVVFANAPKGSKLASVVENLRENSQLVVISGSISQSFRGATAASDDPRYPTCFENRFGLTGCQVELTRIAPLA